MEAVLRGFLRKARSTKSKAALGRLEQTRCDGFAGETLALVARKRNTMRNPILVDRWLFPNIPYLSYSVEHTTNVVRFIIEHADRLNEVASQLDSVSREVLQSLFVYRALGPAHVELPDTKLKIDQYAIAQTMKVGGSAITAPPFECSTFKVEFNGAHLEMECWLGNIVFSFLLRQYFYDKPHAKVMPAEGDVVIDAGACFGDTALAFAATVGATGEVHSFEPIPKQMAVFRSNMARNPKVSSRVRLHPYALGDKPGQKLTFTDDGAAAHVSEHGPIAVETMSIDEFVRINSIDRVNFIKMDIEGAECAALRGSADVIRQNRPKLAISIYHSLNDMIAIQLLIRQLCPTYRFFIDHYSAHEPETVLYATCEPETLM